MRNDLLEFRIKTLYEFTGVIIDNHKPNVVKNAII